MNKKDYLDKGYVRLVDHMGSDLTVVNAARVSFDKESTEFSDADGRLLKFLLREGHTSPFRHAFLQFEIKAPLFVCRQHWKYVIGSDHTLDAWNELSKRYTTDTLDFYIPDSNSWRSAPENKKQGSGEKLSSSIGDQLTAWLEDDISNGVYRYNKALELGVAPEEARLFLNANSQYTRYYWSCSLQSVLHFLIQRLAHDAQYEIQLLAQVINEFVQQLFPETHKVCFE